MAEDTSFDLREFLSHDDGDFLINRKGDKVDIATHLQGKIVGIYFSDAEHSRHHPWRRFTADLARMYGEINAYENLFEIVFVSIVKEDEEESFNEDEKSVIEDEKSVNEDEEESFNDYLAEMPWLAVPFSARETRRLLSTVVDKIPHLLILKADLGSTSAKVIQNDAVRLVRYHGAEVFPFSEEKVEEVDENQTVTRVLGSWNRDYLLNKNGDKVPLSELEGKIVGILFYHADIENCKKFMPRLANACQELKQRGEPFEVVLVSYPAKDTFEVPPPLLAMPPSREFRTRLNDYFDVEELPRLVILGQDGTTVHYNATRLVKGLGAKAYPFTPEKEEELLEAKQKKRTLERMLIVGELDYLVGKDGVKVSVTDLVGKTVLIYFCRRNSLNSFPRLVEVYNELKSEGKDIEVVFAPDDEAGEAYCDYIVSMPWLALPLFDPRQKIMTKLFHVSTVWSPKMVVLDPSGKMATQVDARYLVDKHGAAAYPFTEARIRELEAAEADGLPDRIKLKKHKHALSLTRRPYFGCDICRKNGLGQSFCCRYCNFDVHLTCIQEAGCIDEDGED